MTTLFVSLFLLSIIALVIALIRPTLFRMSRKRAGTIFGIAIVVFFIGIAITAPPSPPSAVHTAVAAQTARQTPPMTSQTGSKAAPAPASTASAPVSTASAPTLEQKISGYAVQTYGNGIALDSIQKDTTGGLTVTLNVTDGVYPNVFEDNTAKLTARIFQDAFGYNPSAQDVSVIYDGAKVDQYGNTSNGQLMGYYVTKATYAKFNWSNFNYFNLCDVLRQAGNQDDPNSDYADACVIYASNLQ